MSAGYRDERLQVVRSLLEKSANAKHAAFHKEYHKSSKKFYGLRAKQMTDISKSVFPVKIKIPKVEVLRLIKELWASDWFEEQAIGLLLLERFAKELAPNDLPYVKKMIGECEGWGIWIGSQRKCSELLHLITVSKSIQKFALGPKANISGRVVPQYSFMFCPLEKRN